MKKKIFSCKSVIHRSIPLNNLNYYNLIISCLSICYYSFFSCGTSLTERSNEKRMRIRRKEDKKRYNETDYFAAVFGCCRMCSKR